MMSFTRIAAVTIGLFLVTQALAQDVTSLAGNCDACHGDSGVSQRDAVPSIAGLPQFSHADALYLYRDGERPCLDYAYLPDAGDKADTNMCEVVKALDDDAIEAIADHYAAMPFTVAAQAFDAGLATAGEAVHEQHCDRCHSDGGSNPDDEAGILAGQWMGYMRASFEQYASGERWQDEKMQEKMELLSEGDIEALLNYYASQQ